MKKFFCKVAVIATIMAGGMSAASCGSDDILNAIETALNIWQQINAGETINFTGASTVQHATANENGDFTYNPTTGQATVSSHSASLVVKSNQAAITLGDFTVDGYKVSNIQLPAVTYSNGTIGDTEGEMVYNCSFSLTKDGTTTNYTSPAQMTDDNYTPCAVVTGSIKEDGKIELSVTILVTDSESFNIKYSGNKVVK